MAKFRKKPVVTEITQWLKNGDHPDDNTLIKNVNYLIEVVSAGISKETKKATIWLKSKYSGLHPEMIFLLEEGPEYAESGHPCIDIVLRSFVSLDNLPDKLQKQVRDHLSIKPIKDNNNE